MAAVVALADLTNRWLPCDTIGSASPKCSGASELQRLLRVQQNSILRKSKPSPDGAGDTVMPAFQIAQRVLVACHEGTVCFVGAVDFETGTWVGVELDEASGNHDGSMRGVRYFKCKPGHGVLVPERLISAVPFYEPPMHGLPESPCFANLVPMAAICAPRALLVSSFIRCACPGGLCYRSSPEPFANEISNVLNGDVVRIESRRGNWVRAALGWLPLINADGLPLFVPSSSSECRLEEQQPSFKAQFVYRKDAEVDSSLDMQASPLPTDLAGLCQAELSDEEPADVDAGCCFTRERLGPDAGIQREDEGVQSRWACLSRVPAAASTVKARKSKPDQRDVFVIAYSEDWGVVFEEHMCQLQGLGRRIQDFVVTDRHGFEVDIADSAEVPDPGRFPLRCVWKGLPDAIVQQQCQQLDVAESQEIVHETHLSDLALVPPPVPLQPWEVEKLKSVATQVVTAIQSRRFVKDFGQILLAQFRGWQGADKWAQAEEARLASLVDGACDQKQQEELQHWIESSLLKTLCEVEKELNRGHLEGVDIPGRNQMAAIRMTWEEQAGNTPQGAPIEVPVKRIDDTGDASESSASESSWVFTDP